MKKYVLWPLLAAIGGVGAFLLRLLQRSTGFEVDTGLPIPGNLYAILLVAAAERPEEIDLKRAEAARQRAEERLRQKESLQEYHSSQAALARALARLKTARK